MTQRILEYAQTTAFNLFKTGCLVLVAFVLCSWAFSLEHDDAVVVPAPIYGAPGAEATRVKMAVGPGRSCSTYSLEDEQGRELLRVTYLRTGFVVVNLGETFPIRPGFSAGVDGNYEFVLAHEGVNHRLRVRPDGESGFTVARQSRRVPDDTRPPTVDEDVSSDGFAERP